MYNVVYGQWLPSNVVCCQMMSSIEQKMINDKVHFLMFLLMKYRCNRRNFKCLPPLRYYSSGSFKKRVESNTYII